MRVPTLFIRVYDRETGQETSYGTKKTSFFSIHVSKDMLPTSNFQHQQRETESNFTLVVQYRYGYNEQKSGGSLTPQPWMYGIPESSP